MRLANRDQLALPLHGAGSLQYGRNLYRVMTIIINNADGRLAFDRHPFPDLCEAALHPAKLPHRGPDLIVCGA